MAKTINNKQPPLLSDTDNESLTEFVGSRGIMKSCNIYSLTPVSNIRTLVNYPSISSIKYTTKYPVIHVCSSAINDFINNMLPKLNMPFILVSGDCYLTVPFDIFLSNEKFEIFINNTKIIHWYCQNWVGDHPKVTQVPLGLDYHTMANREIYWGPMTSPLNQEALLKKIISSSKPFWERKPICYGNYHFLTTTRYGTDRTDAFSSISKELTFYEPKQNMRAISWYNQLQYAFVISPHGNGLDCHRTWEALILGCIPIVKKSQLDPLYEKLPVLIVNEWKDVTSELLSKTISDFSEKHRAGCFNYEKLTLKYWVNIINQHNL